MSITDLANTADRLTPDRLCRLTAEALVVSATPGVDLDNDHVTALLAQCLALPLEDKRRLNDLLALAIHMEEV